MFKNTSGGSNFASLLCNTNNKVEKNKTTGTNRIVPVVTLLKYALDVCVREKVYSILCQQPFFSLSETHADYMDIGLGHL